MSKLYVFPFKETSEGAILLRDTLGTTFVNGSERMTRDDVVINWGCGYRTPPGQKVFNKSSAINNAIDKLVALKRFFDFEVPCPDWTTSKVKAQAWLEQGHSVYARATACGQNGAGIKIYNQGDTIDRAYAFYSKRFPASREFRVNVAFGEAIDVCEKKRRTGTTPSHLMRVGDDWVYCREHLERYPEAIKTAAVMGVNALDLDFGGVDVGLSNDGEVCVFEVNTAPWLGSIIARKYANAFEQAILQDREWERD